MGVIRLLLVADTHLGFDQPCRPRVERRRRGPDFFANFRLALAPARRAEVDAVVHAGDLLYRSRVPNQLVEQAFGPLREVADAGIPVFVVPGNHERSHIPHALWACHRRIEVFHEPRTRLLELPGGRLALAGFPCCRQGVRHRFVELVRRTGIQRQQADAAVLCVHQCVEGATVGPAGFVFRGGSDVVRAADLPVGLSAVVAGHIHRHQVLLRDLRQRPLAAPVVIPGSTERTSMAERHETKGYVVLEIEPTAAHARGRCRWRFQPLPTRSMHQVTLSAAGLGRHELGERVRRQVAELPADGVVLLRVVGPLRPGAADALRAAALRALAPPSMNLTVSVAPRNG